MPSLTFLYTGIEKNTNNEKVLIKMVNKLAQKLPLPIKFEIEFTLMKPNAYAETLINPRFNRIKLNADLGIKESIIVLTHELIHLSQLFTKKLQYKTNNIVIWENKLYDLTDATKLSYEEYQQLPWELDVAAREKDLLRFLLQD